ncbi:uncharacterized protein LOC131543439 [Onychostoma macrolepis]|uniref:uncharacterized protein LOC131543439 n=1 Tax=Onychostoma macrolepis TaxID=369639 RepID=UPI00272A24CC|nr:uncharacterized protein LOC131543439 [Onychostoma macrolepis]
MAIGMNIEVAELELENLFPGLLINLLSTTLNTLRHAQPLTIVGAVIMCFWVFGLRDSENEELCLGRWGMIIAITSELKTPKTAVLIIITGVAMMSFGSTEGQHVYGDIIAFILNILLIMPLMIPFVITFLANVIAQSVPVSDICATVVAVTAIVRLRAVMCFFTHIITQYVGLIKAIFKTVCVFGAIVIFSFIIALLLIFVGWLPHSFWGDDDNARLLQFTVKTLCWMSFFYEVIPSVRAAELGLQAADLKAVQTVIQMFAILDAVITLAVIYGIAVLVRVQPPAMKARGGLILACMGVGATLAVALAVWMVHGQAMLLKGLAGSVLISAFLFFIFKITMQSIRIQPLCNNAPEVVKQLGSIYVATLVMSLGVALMPLMGMCSGWDISGN